MEGRLRNTSNDHINNSNQRSARDTKQNYYNNLDSIDKSNINLENIVDYIRRIEEINDIIFIDAQGKVVFFHSAQNTQDLEYLNSLEEEFQLFYKILDDPEKTIPNFVRKFKNLYDFLYKKGVKLLEREFIPTRIAIPFIFSRDVTNNEELAIIKVKSKSSTNKKYFVLVTYFMDFTSPLIISYFKEILNNYFSDIVIDDDYMRNL